MTPILYSATETAFTSEGLGRLSDAISCIVTEERNGEYELLMEYPVTGALFDQIQHSAVIAAVPADGKAAQPFRIYRIEKPIGGICTIYAEHISYQLNSIPVMPFEASGIVNALNGLVTNAAENCPFTVWTDKETSGTYRVTEPTAFRSLLGGQEGSILDVFGTGEYEFDKWAVKLYLHRGTDNGVSIRYGKNLTDLNQDENIQSTYTGVCPYWMNSETGDIVTLPEKVVWSANADNFPYKRTTVVSFNEQFQEAPSVNELRTAAQHYIVANNFGVPSVNLEVSYIDLHSITGGILERVNLCDTVTVVFETLGVSATAKVIKTEYDVLKDRYEQVTIGDAKSSIDEVIDSTVEQVVSENIENEVTQLMKYVENQTALITGGLGGYVVINQNADGYPNEILIMDTPDKETAVNVIRMNQNGIGFSTNGYDGPFSTAWTIDGVFNASFIGAGRMDGAYIKANTISAAHMTIGDPTNYVTVIEQYPSSMLDADNPLGATVITSSGYVSKGAASNHILGMSDILANGFAYGDELYYEFDAYAPSAKTVRMAVIGYDAEKNELERFYSEPISITTSLKRFTGSVSMDYAHIDGDGNLVLPMASVSGGTLNLTYGQVDGETIRFTNYMNLWKYYAIVLLDESSTQLYFRRAVIRKKYGGDLIVSGAISADKIMIGAVSEGKLASSVSRKIDGAVSSSANAMVAAQSAYDRAFNADTAAGLAQSTADDALSKSVIAQAAADAVAGTMEDITKIEDGVTWIDGGKIYTNSIVSRSIASLAVTSDKIAANAIVAGKIAAGAVTADMIISGTMSANRILGGTMKLGGSGNVNGQLKVYDAASNLVGQWDNETFFSKQHAASTLSNSYISLVFSKAYRSVSASFLNYLGSLFTITNGSTYPVSSAATGWYAFGNTDYTMLRVGWESSNVSESDQVGAYVVAHPNGGSFLARSHGIGMDSSITGRPMDNETQPVFAAMHTRCDDNEKVVFSISIRNRHAEIDLRNAGAGSQFSRLRIGQSDDGSAELLSFNGKDVAYQSSIGTLSNLTTTAKSNLVGAINEVNNIATTTANTVDSKISNAIAVKTTSTSSITTGSAGSISTGLASTKAVLGCSLTSGTSNLCIPYVYNNTWYVRVIDNTGARVVNTTVGYVTVYYIDT